MTRTTELPVAVSDPSQWLTRRAAELAPKLRAMADETRLTLLLLIAQRPRTVKELQEATGLSQTLVSHHLTPLREQQLVSVEAKGRSNQYTLCCTALAAPVRVLASMAALDPDGIAALADATAID